MKLPDYIFPGAFVALRNGDKGRIYATDCGETGDQIHGARLINRCTMGWWTICWPRFGQFAAPDPFDIVGPWTDKPDCSKLWPILPPWLNWIAVDAGGSWCAYPHNPEVRALCWYAEGFLAIPDSYAPTFSGDWKDSLCERPKS